MTILDRYLLNKILVPFFYCVAGFLSVWLVWDLGVNLPDFISGHAGPWLIVRFYMLQIPSVLMLSVPVGLLLALLYTLTQMSRRNEIISMLCAGRSLERIFIPLVAVGLLLTGVLALLNHKLAPEAGYVRDAMKEEIKTGRKKIFGCSADYLYRNREDRRLWFLSIINRDSNEARRVEIIQQNESGVVSDKWYALHVFYVPETRTWVLNDARHVTVDEAGNQVTTETMPRLEITDWKETPWKIVSATMNPEYLGLADLSNYLKNNAEFPKSRLAPFVTHWHYRWALPWVCLVVVFIAGPLGVVIGRRGILGGVGAAITLFAGLIFSSSLFLALGKGDRIPPWVAAWAPFAMFLGIGAYLFWLKATGRELPKFRLPGF